MKILTNEIMNISILDTEGKKYHEDQTIDNQVILALKRGFGDVDSYLKHLSVLWELRELVVAQIDNNNPTQSKLYPALHTINELIGVLVLSRKGFEAFLKLNPNA